MTDFKDVTNLTQCRWLLSGANSVQVDAACNCQLTLRDKDRKNVAIEKINSQNRNLNTARKASGKQIYDEYIELLRSYQDDYIRDMNRLRKEVKDIGDNPNCNKLGCTGPFECEEDCFGSNMNPKRCYAGSNKNCGLFGSGARAKCLLTHQEVMDKMANVNKIGPWENADKILPKDGSLGTIETMTTPFFDKDVPDRGTPGAAGTCNNDYRKPNGKIIPDYTPPNLPHEIEKDQSSLACCNNIMTNLGYSGANIINQTITGCGGDAKLKKKARKTVVEQSVSSIDDPSRHPLVSFAYDQPILAPVSAGSVALLVFTVIFSILFQSAWIGMGIGFLFGITVGVAAFIILKRVIDDKDSKLLADFEMVNQERENSKAEYIQKIAEIEAEVREGGSCDAECGDNSVKEKLGGNFQIGQGDDKRCICVCKPNFSPKGLERPACQPEKFVCTAAAKESLNLPNAGVVTCGTTLKSSPPNLFFDNETAAQNVCCERLEVEPSDTF
jgi:hypothetical protein